MENDAINLPKVASADKEALLGFELSAFES